MTRSSISAPCNCLLVLSFMLLSGFLTLEQAARADFWINRPNRIANTMDGVCAFSSLETLGRHHGIKQLIGLTEWAKKNVPGGARLDQILPKLAELGVGYIAHESVAFGQPRPFDAIIKACDDKWGCVVSLHNWAARNGPHAHAVVLTSINPDYVIIFDTNDFSFYHMSRSWFNDHWHGWCIILKKE